MRSRRRSALTLLEVLIVVVLIGLLVAFAWPNFGAAGRAGQLEESVRRFKAVVNLCRAEAMNQARRYRLSIRLDGTLRVSRQGDALQAPDEYYRVRANWAETPVLLDDVWIEGVLALPYGPPPIYIENEDIVFTEEEDGELEVPLIEDLDEEVAVDFEPDGTCDSIRWTLRDALGRGVQLTLDGRIGRIQVEPLPRIPEDELERPEREPIDDEQDEEEEPEDFGR